MSGQVFVRFGLEKQNLDFQWFFNVLLVLSWLLVAMLGPSCLVLGSCWVIRGSFFRFKGVRLAARFLGPSEKSLKAHWKIEVFDESGWPAFGLFGVGTQEMLSWVMLVSFRVILGPVWVQLGAILGNDSLQKQRY